MLLTPPPPPLHAPGGPKAEVAPPVMAPNLEEGLPELLAEAALLLVVELVLLSKVVVELFTMLLVLLLVIAAASVGVLCSTDAVESSEL